MEVDGKEFMRNVGIEQDKEKLAREQKRLEALKREAYLREEGNLASSEEAAFVDLSLNSGTPSQDNMVNEPTIEDLKLDQGDPNAQKKKYILLGIALILIFVITILVIRLISNSDTEQKMENLNPQQQELGADKILNKIDTNEEYQKAIDKNLAKEEQRKIDEAKKSTVPDMGLVEEKVENTPLVIEKPKPKELKKDLFGLNETQAKETPKEVVKEEVKKTANEPKNAIDSIYKKIEDDDKAQEIVTKKVKTESSVFTPPKPKAEPKKVVKAEPKKPEPVTTPSKKVSGYYIQIGAFTKQPGAKLLNEIKAKGFSYVVYPTVVKGKKYNKVLIGSYGSRKEAQNNLNDVKQKLNKSGAYILKF